MLYEEPRSEDSIVLIVNRITLNFMGIDKVVIHEFSSDRFTIILEFNYDTARITIECNYYELKHGDKVKVDYHG